MLDAILISDACRLVPSSRPGRKLHPSTIRRWCHEGKLAYWDRNGTWFVSLAELRGLMREMRRQGNAETEARRARLERDRATDEVLRGVGVR